MTMQLNNLGYPYIPVPDEYFAELSALEDPETLHDSMSYDEYLRACGKYESLYEWLESYYYEQYGPAPMDQEYDPEHLARLFDRFETLATRFYAVEKAPQIVAASLARNTPDGASNDSWALYAMATDPVSIGALAEVDDGYPLLLRALALTGELDTALLVYAPTWFPQWLHDAYVRHPYVYLGSHRPTADEIEDHATALRLWRPDTPSHVFHEYGRALHTAQRIWQHIPVPVI
jgi:hypothetical protein